MSPATKTIPFASNGTAAGTGAVPPPYVVDACVWVVSDDPNAAGVAIFVKGNVSLLERDAFVDAEDAIAEYAKDWASHPDDEKDQDDTPATRRYALIAPLIKAWNVHATNAATGEVEPVPPPAEAGPDAFKLVSLPASTWMVQAISFGYRTGFGVGGTSPDGTSWGKARRWSGESAPTAGTASGGKTGARS